MDKQGQARIESVISHLSAISDGEEVINHTSGSSLPSVEALKKIIQLVKDIIFPGYFDKSPQVGVIRTCYIGMAVEQLTQLLEAQIARSLIFNQGTEGTMTEFEAQSKAQELTLNFVEQLPEIKRLIYTDVDAMVHNDPAVKSSGEVIFCYPMVIAMTHHRVAHSLLRLGVPVIPRIISELAHSQTGIDIHPGAQIGDHFCIDHGTGIVVGETCIIGSHVMLYQGVTLGAKSFSYDDNGVPLNVPRHPIIEDNVTIYSNTSVLGRITIGHDTVIGGNVWQTRSVPPHSLIVQSRPVMSTFTDGAGI